MPREATTHVSISAATLREGDALIVVDVQQDFLPGGHLAVPNGDAVIAVLNRCAGEFGRNHLPVFATRDWHPADHRSFREHGGPWPPHCVAGTPGAEFPSTLILPHGTEVISKGVLPQAEGYSGFEGTRLAQRLRELGCRRVFIGGLATDYCVRATTLDALKEGFEVILMEDAVRSVDVQPGDGARALAELVAHGARLGRHEDARS
jgi:nicotinamidase/pyrazinamidase